MCCVCFVFVVMYIVMWSCYVVVASLVVCLCCVVFVYVLCLRVLSFVCSFEDVSVACYVGCGCCVCVVPLCSVLVCLIVCVC